MRHTLMSLALLLGCADPIETPDAGHPRPDLGPCAILAGTPTDAGPVAHVVVLPNGYPCGDAGMCSQGECIMGEP